MRLRFDASASVITIDAFAEGLLSAFAHDMRIEARGGSGESSDGERIEVQFPVGSLVATESSKKGKSSYQTMDAKDGRDVEARLRTQVFAGLGAIRVEANHDGEVFVIAQRRAKANLNLSVREDDRAIFAEGTGTLSLAAIGAGKVKVPMGAMKLKDELRIRVKVRLERFT